MDDIIREQAQRFIDKWHDKDVRRFARWALERDQAARVAEARLMSVRLTLLNADVPGGWLVRISDIRAALGDHHGR